MSARIRRRLLLRRNHRIEESALTRAARAAQGPAAFLGLLLLLASASVIGVRAAGIDGGPRARQAAEPPVRIAEPPVRMAGAGEAPRVIIRPVVPAAPAPQRRPAAAPAAPAPKRRPAAAPDRSSRPSRERERSASARRERERERERERTLERERSASAQRERERARERAATRERTASRERTAREEAPRRGESASVLNARAYRLQRRGRHREAEPLLRRALELRPDYAYAQYNLGWSLLEQGRAREAIEPLRKTAARQPGRWEPQQRLADAYERLGQKERAEVARERARALRGGRGAARRQRHAEPRESRRRESPAARAGQEREPRGGEARELGTREDGGRPERGAAADLPVVPRVVRARIAETAWIGSTDRGEERYYRIRREWLRRQAAARAPAPRVGAEPSVPLPDGPPPQPAPEDQ